jgi:hypothetical protein
LRCSESTSGRSVFRASRRTFWTDCVLDATRRDVAGTPPCAAPGAGAVTFRPRFHQSAAASTTTSAPSRMA